MLGGEAAGIASGERRSLVTALEIAAGYYGGSVTSMREDHFLQKFL